MKGVLGAPPGAAHNSGGGGSDDEALFHAYTPGAPYAFEPRTPVVSAQTNSYNISTAASQQQYHHQQQQQQQQQQQHQAFAFAASPWTADEHDRFLDALEQYGANVQFTSPEFVWRTIAHAVRTRAVHDVKVHASQYFLELQRAQAQRRSEHLFMQSVDARWTLEDDARFEHLLADHVASAAAGASAVCFPWEVLAAKMPGKTPRDVQERFHKLCYDIARIEAGQHVMMSYGGASSRLLRSNTSSNRHAAAVQVAGNDATVALPGADSSRFDPIEQAQGWDCVVTLTADEEANLMDALAQAHVSPHAAPQLLESIASAMAALTNARHRIPPQRTSARFTVADARAVFDELLHEPSPPSVASSREQLKRAAVTTTSPETVLELLARRLHLQPQQLQYQSGSKTDDRSELTRSEATPQYQSGSSAYPLKPLATSGLAFGDAAPSPLYSPARFLMGASVKSDTLQRSGATPDDLMGFHTDASGHSGGSGGNNGSDSGYLGVGGSSVQRQQHMQSASDAANSAVPPYVSRNRELQSMFSTSSSSNNSYSPAPLPSPTPFSRHVGSFTPRAGATEARGNAAGGDGADGGSDGRTAATGGNRGSCRGRMLDAATAGAQRESSAGDRAAAVVTHGKDDENDDDSTEVKEDAATRDFSP